MKNLTTAEIRQRLLEVEQKLPGLPQYCYWFTKLLGDYLVFRGRPHILKTPCIFMAQAYKTLQDLQSGRSSYYDRRLPWTIRFYMQFEKRYFDKIFSFIFPEAEEKFWQTT